MTRALLQQALEALEIVCAYATEYEEVPFEQGEEAITAIREYLAQPEQEPTAWLITYKATSRHGIKQFRQMANLTDEIPDTEEGWTMEKIKSEPLSTKEQL